MSSSFVTDLPILDRDYKAEMVAESFELAYVASPTTSKLRMSAFKLLITNDENETLVMEQHGDKSATLSSSSSPLPADISQITAVSNANDGVKGLIFSSRTDSSVNVSVIPNSVFDVKASDIFSTIQVPSNYRLAGVQSISQQTSIAKIVFLFVETDDKRCQVPSNKLIADAAAIFVTYDEDKDGLISVEEWNKVIDKSGQTDTTSSHITESLTLSQFTDHIIPELLNENGEIDLTKLSVDV